MPKMTMIGRVSDGLPLAASMADEKDAYGSELDSYERQAKKILRTVSRDKAKDTGDFGVGLTNAGARLGPSHTPEPYVTIESGDYFCFHYIVDGGVCILTLTEKAYPRRLAYDYLDELRREFLTVHGAQVANATRPYECIRFDTFIQKTKKLYSDSRTQRNLDKLNRELRDVHSIVNKSISEVLGRGEKLDAITDKSTRLVSASKDYAKRAQHANRMRVIKQYAPIGAVVVVVLVCFWWFYLR